MERAEMLAVFVDESRDLLVQMEDILLRAEQEALEPEDTHALFRCAHTIKGSAGMFGFDAVVHFTHDVESVLDGLRKNSLQLSGELVNLLLECQDHMARSISDVLAGEKPDARLEALLTERLHRIYSTPPVPSIGPHGALTVESEDAAPVSPDLADAESGHWRLSLRFAPDVMRDGNDPLKMIRYLQEYGEIVHLETITDALPDLHEANAESCYLRFEITMISQASQTELEDVFSFVSDVSGIRIVRQASAMPESCKDAVNPASKNVASIAAATPASSHQKQASDRRLGDITHVKVPSGKLDSLVDQVGEMVIAGAAAQLKALKSGDNELQESIATLLRLVEDVRDMALCLRMTPVGEVFHRFPRVVRDLARELGKDIELIIHGADTELDKSMVEKIADPLMHLVRNSVDHGIESPDKRIVSGKREKGTLTLSAHHESGSIIIEVSDDGAGLNATRIRQKAIERGLILPDAQLTDNQVWRLVLEPGFSTAEHITSVSGRGVGMDVVKTTIESLRGSLDIESVPGVGTTMRVALPITLAIIDGFQVGVGSNTFILPLDAVEACIDISPDQDNNDCIDLRGVVMPIVRLPALFHMEYRSGLRSNIVVVRFAGRQAAILVDRLNGECQAVIKPLGPMFEQLRGIAGSTILGSGEVALVLDVPQLIQVASGLAIRQVADSMRTAVQPLH